LAVRGKEVDVRAMLVELGVPSFNATMAIPFMFLLPGTTDPDSPSVIEIIKGLQRGLKRLGYRKLAISGLLDQQTARVLDQISPPAGSWLQKTWVQLYGDVLATKKQPVRKVHEMRMESLGSYFEYDGPPVGPLPGILVGTPPGPLGMGATTVDAGVALDFGTGTKSATTMVPTNSTTDAAFRNVQRQINRLLSAIRGGTIGEDGLIGKGTWTAYSKVVDQILRASFEGVENTAGLAANAVTMANIMSAKADEMGISKTANRGAAQTVAKVVEKTLAPMDSTQLSAVRTAGIGGLLGKYAPYLLLAGGVAWFAASQRKGKRKKRKR
jgi:hypothetical protein